MNLLPKRPQRVGETLDAGFVLYRRSFTAALPLTAFTAAFGAVPGILGPLIGETAPMSFGIVVFLWLGLMLFLNSLMMSATIALIGSHAKDEPLTRRQALSVGLNRMLPMLGSLLMYGLIMMTGMLLLIIPGLVLLVTMMFGSYALVLDGKGPIDALGFSHSLVWGRWWRTVTLVSVSAAVAFTLMALFQLPFFALMDNEVMMMVGLEIGNMIGSAVGMPLIYATMITCYYELKLRARGEDLEERINAAAVPA